MDNAILDKARIKLDNYLLTEKTAGWKDTAIHMLGGGTSGGVVGGLIGSGIGGLHGAYNGYNDTEGSFTDKLKGGLTRGVKGSLKGGLIGGGIGAGIGALQAPYGIKSMKNLQMHNLDTGLIDPIIISKLTNIMDAEKVSLKDAINRLYSKSIYSKPFGKNVVGYYMSGFASPLATVGRLMESVDRKLLGGKFFEGSNSFEPITEELFNASIKKG